jgi:hypothetical protein
MAIFAASNHQSTRNIWPSYARKRNGEGGAIQQALTLERKKEQQHNQRIGFRLQSPLRTHFALNVTLFRRPPSPQRQRENQFFLLFSKKKSQGVHGFEQWSLVGSSCWLTWNAIQDAMEQSEAEESMDIPAQPTQQVFPKTHDHRCVLWWVPGTGSVKIAHVGNPCVLFPVKDVIWMETQRKP